MQLTDAIEEFRLDCKMRKLADKTISNYNKQLKYLQRYLLSEFALTELEAVKQNHIRSFIMKKEDDQCKPRYLNDLLKVFRTFFRYCYGEGYISTIPTNRIKNVRQPKLMLRGFTEDEILKMLNYCNGNDFLSLRNKTMLAMFFDTGMRLTEVLTLRPDQIKEDYIVVYGKGSKERVVPVSPYLGRLLMKYKIARDKYFDSSNLTPKSLVFVSYRGKQLTAEAITKFMRIVASAVGVSEDVRVSPHTCRHTFANLQLKNGLDIYSLSRLLGHENITITQRYLDGIRNDEVLEQVKKTGILQHL